MNKSKGVTGGCEMGKEVRLEKYGILKARDIHFSVLRGIPDPSVSRMGAKQILYERMF